jgi:hypothetical protein
MPTGRKVDQGGEKSPSLFIVMNDVVDFIGAVVESTEDRNQ